MAKQISLIILFLGLCVANAFSQAQVEFTTGTNLYERALAACVTEQFKRFGNQGSETRLRLLNRVVERDNFFTDKLPTQFGEIKVEYLDQQDIIDRYKKNRSEIFVTIITPMKNEGTTLKISFRDYYVSYKKRSYRSGLEGGCIVDFNFDKQLDTFTITKIDLWGV